MIPDAKPETPAPLPDRDEPITLPEEIWDGSL